MPLDQVDARRPPTAPRIAGHPIAMTFYSTPLRRRPALKGISRGSGQCRRVQIAQ